MKDLILPFSLLVEILLKNLLLLQLLKDEGAYGKEIAKKIGLDAATVSRHLSVLQKCGLIYMERREGRNIYYRTNQGEIRNLLELLQKIFINETE